MKDGEGGGERFFGGEEEEEKRLRGEGRQLMGERKKESVMGKKRMRKKKLGRKGKDRWRRIKEGKMEKILEREVGGR